MSDFKSKGKWEELEVDGTIWQVRKGKWKRVKQKNSHKI